MFSPAAFPQPPENGNTRKASPQIGNGDDPHMAATAFRVLVGTIRNKNCD
jgi:hypothetical protein